MGATYALQLQTAFNMGPRSATVLDLDCYLSERAERERGVKVITGYNPAGYALHRAAQDIRALLAGTTITVTPYDKTTSTKMKPVPFCPADILIIEGAMALHDELLSFGNLRVFLDASPAVLQQNRKERERALGFDEHRIQKKFKLLMADYDRFIAPQRSHAYILVTVAEDYEFSNLTIRGSTSTPWTRDLFEREA